MFDKRRKYSYAEQKHQRSRIARIAVWVFAIFVFYSFFSVFLGYTIVVHNDTMRPGIAYGDRLLVSSFGYSDSFLFYTARDSVDTSLRRGSLVVVDLSRLDGKRGGLTSFSDKFVQFFSAQFVDIDAHGERRFLKRVVALPGDEVSMKDFVLRVRPSGDPYALTEFELAARPYDVSIPSIPDGWNDALPFSGTMEKRVLGSDECFLISDDRGNTNDSRSWGPTPMRAISGKVLFRYWPLQRVGRP